MAGPVLLMALPPAPREAMPPLTLRDLDVLRTWARTGSEAEAAHQLGVSRRTVARHLERCRRECKVQATVQALWILFGDDRAA